MKLTVLIENTAAREDVQAEHGLSLYIEACGRRILFDMGQTDRFAENAAVLGVDLAAVDLAILSHGHYDHGGGLAAFLACNDRAPVLVHRDAFLPHYHGSTRYIGLDPALAAHPRIVRVAGDTALGEGLLLTDCAGRPQPFAPSGADLTERVGDRFVPDDFRHEQYLQLTEAGRRVLISGCSHRGIHNIMTWFSPDVLIGGFHFSSLPLDGALAESAMRLDAWDADYYTCHCTGAAQYAMMAQYMHRLHALSGGQTLRLGETAD